MKRRGVSGAILASVLVAVPVAVGPVAENELGSRNA